jgi:hypothetical protein
MANSKATALTAVTLPDKSDILYLVDDPAGTPLSRKITVEDLIDTGSFSQTAGVTVANTVTETALPGAGEGSLTLDANYLEVGRSLLLKAYGVVSDTGTPTLTVRFKIGGTEIVSTGALSTGGSLSNAGWDIEVLLTCRTAGASGTVFVNGLFRHSTTLTPLTSTSTDTVDTTGTLALDVTAQWDTASASNTITCDNLVVTQLR